MASPLHAAVDPAEQEPDIRVIVVTGRAGHSLPALTWVRRVRLPPWET
ncbi:hypothetical protein [Mycobacterium vicinigordonae]|uniref:Uncharacterized protein n=1 Tax=Mycobacterium vicinigordonae TaxID=1719132 RepID=A0A7D6DVW4_9MYCO|nr:hypothetical protein [Mycobacterium vicinigordonae]QLL06064.1 hypothetical protein H0P51_20100 [Mycobacterium vicinigordonae]